MIGVSNILNALSLKQYGTIIYRPEGTGFVEISVIENRNANPGWGGNENIGYDEVSIIELGAAPKFKVSSAIKAKGTKITAYSNLFGLSCEKYNLTADSEPDLDSWGPDCYWEGEHWVEWHKLNVEKYGKAKADTKFQQSWAKRSAFGHELWIANNDGAFISYVKSQGLDQSVPDLKTIYGQRDAQQSALNTADNIVKAADNTSAAAANAAKSVGTFAKWLPWIALAGVAIIGYLMVSRKSVNVI